MNSGMFFSELIAGGFKSAFNDFIEKFTKEQKARDMALLDSIGSLSTDNQEIKAAIAAEREQVSSIQQQLDTLAQTNNDQQTTINSLLQQVSEGTQSLETAQAEVDRLHAENAQIIADIQGIFTPAQV